jgi:hypothetical protein
MKEIKYLRNKYSKTYCYSSTKNQLRVSTKPFHYLSGNSWEEIEINFQDEGQHLINWTNEVTVGFRKDKQLYKFLGLRYNYDHQFELTPHSIEIDDEEKITQSTFQEVFLKEGPVKKFYHHLPDISFLTIIKEQSLSNYVKIEEPLEKVDITYQLHLKGLVVTNDLINNKYLPDKNGTFILSGASEEQIFFIRKPKVFDSDNKTYQDLMSHSLYLSGDTLFYTKSSSPDFNLNNFEYPIYVDIQSFFERDSFNGILKFDSSDNGLDDWYYLRNSQLCGNTINPYYSSDATYGKLGLIRWPYSTVGQYSCSRIFINWKDVNIPSNAIINNDAFISGIIDAKSFLKPNNPNYNSYNPQVVLVDSNHNPNTLTTDNNNFYLTGSTFASTPFATGDETISLDESVFNIIRQNILQGNFTLQMAIMDYDYDYLGARPAPVGTDPPLDINGAKMEFRESDDITDPDEPLWYELYLNYKVGISGIEMIPSSGSTSNWTTDEWSFNSANTNIVSQIEDFDVISLFTLGEIPFSLTPWDKPSGTTQYLGGREYIITLDNDTLSDIQYNSLIKVEDSDDVYDFVVEVAGTGHTCEVTSKSVSVGNIVYGLHDFYQSGGTYESIPNGSWPWRSKYKDRSSFIDSNSAVTSTARGLDFIISGVSYKSRIYPGDSNDYTTLKFTDILDWVPPNNYQHKKLYCDRLSKADNKKWYNGSFRNGYFSASWYGGQWVLGEWFGLNQNNINKFQVPGNNPQIPYLPDNNKEFPTI